MLTNKRREFLYAMTVFGPNLIFTMIMAYFLSAVNPQNLDVDGHLMTWLWKTQSDGGVVGLPIVFTTVFGILFTIGRIFDAFIDIPLAAKLDRMKDRYARLRRPILISIVPMLVGTVMLCTPLTVIEDSVLNTIWFFIACIIFFAAYTLTMVAFYGGLSGICTSRKQRTRVSMFKSFIDTVQYALAYALAPLILAAFRGTGLNIMHLILILSPLMLTVLIPLIMSKGYREETEISAANNEAINIAANESEPKKTGTLSSLLFVSKNRAFWPWMLVVFVYFMGLQLFLSMQNELISGVLQLKVEYAALLNAAAFGPVPVMLFFFNKLMKKKGVRFALQASILSFGVGIACFSFGSALFFPDSIMPRIIINLIGGTIASFSIGAFFMLILMIPSQVAAIELKVLKTRNSSMYFAGQGIVVGLSGAIATGLIADTLLRVVISSKISVSTALAGIADGVYNIPLGGFIAPFIVVFLSFIAFAAAFLMPKSYDTKTIGKLFDENYIPDNEDLADQEIDSAAEKEPLKK